MKQLVTLVAIDFNNKQASAVKDFKSWGLVSCITLNKDAGSFFVLAGNQTLLSVAVSINIANGTFTELSRVAVPPLFDTLATRFYHPDKINALVTTGQDPATKQWRLTFVEWSLGTGKVLLDKQIRLFPTLPTSRPVQALAGSNSLLVSYYASFSVGTDSYMVACSPQEPECAVSLFSQAPLAGQLTVMG